MLENFIQDKKEGVFATIRERDSRHDINEMNMEATLINMQHLVFSDYVMKMTVEAPFYFSIVLNLKSNGSN